MLSSRDMKHSLVIGTSRISADIHIRMIINLHIPTALFNVFATTSPPICIYRQHFSTFSTLHRRQPAYTDFTANMALFHHKPAYVDIICQHLCHRFTTNLHTPTALLSSSTTPSPSTCTYRRRFSALLPLFDHQPAYVDSTFQDDELIM